jgi:hypothetical protein
MKRLCLILVISLLVGCSDPGDPGEVNINVTPLASSQKTYVVKVSSVRWVNLDGIWVGLGPPVQGLDIIFIPADVDAADAIDNHWRYMNQ